MSRLLVLLMLIGVFTVSQVGCEMGSNEAKDPAGETKDGESADKGLMGTANDLAKQAKDSSMDGINWVQDKVGDAAGAGADLAGDTSKWVGETFNSLKNQGLTTADNATDWLSEDFNNIGAWQYKVVVAKGDEMAALESQLNELGKSRWECFHVVSKPDGEQVFFFKKRPKSYLRNLPVKDLIKMVPLMGGNGE